MGLDIYLKKYKDFDETRKKEKEYEEKAESNWEKDGLKYDDLSDEDRDSIREENLKLAESMGLDKYGSDESSVESIEHDHPKYKDHIFKIGYFRSSYNGSGINRQFSNMGLPTLQEMFEVDREDYYVRPNWDKAMANVNTAIEKYTDMMANNKIVRVSCSSFNEFMDPSECKVVDEESALKVFYEQQDRYNKGDKSFGSWSSRDGEFYMDSPLQVMGIIPGTKSSFLSKGDSQCTYIVLKMTEPEFY